MDIKKFSFPEMFNNSKGQTSPTIVAGFFACMFSLFGFLISGIIILIMVVAKVEKSSELINVLSTFIMQCIALFTTGAALLATHRLSKDKDISEDALIPDNKEPNPPTP